MRNPLIIALLLTALPAWAGDGLYTVGTHTAALRLSAPARVRPVRTLVVRAATDGSVADLQVVPGEAVHRGQRLAQIAGAEYDMRLAGARSRVAERRAELDAARQVLRGVRRTYPGVTTERGLQQAEAAVREDTARLRAARAQLRFVQQADTVVAATDGTVTELRAANGERVAAGDPLLRLVPVRGLWLQADFYGRDAALLRPGLRGRFRPTGGGPAVAVAVRSVLAPQRPDGARRVGCLPSADTAAWMDGEAGTLELDGPVRTWAVVPTRALVMDRGRWWVLVHDERGDHRQAVTPGPVRGGQTLIAEGLKAGQRVVVSDAYLKFHRDFSHHYQPPD